VRNAVPIALSVPLLGELTVNSNLSLGTHKNVPNELFIRRDA